MQLAAEESSLNGFELFGIVKETGVVSLFQGNNMERMLAVGVFGFTFPLGTFQFFLSCATG